MSRPIQKDYSGVGHCWRYENDEDIPANILDEIRTWEIEDKPTEAEEYLASNGMRYRLR